MLRLVLLVVLGLGLAGCASLSKESCLEGDWYTIGLQDGSNGRKAERRFDHEETCTEHGVSVQVQVDEYIKGREAGLRLYCTPESGYQIGLRVDYYYDVCPADLKPAFTQAYRLGRRQARLRCLWDYHFEVAHYSLRHRYAHRYHWRPYPFYRYSTLDCY